MKAVQNTRQQPIQNPVTKDMIRQGLEKIGIIPNMHRASVLEYSQSVRERSRRMLPEEGSLVYIQSFKHDGSLHRTWCKGFVLKSAPEEIVAVTNKAWVIEADGRRWFTREPAVCFFWPDRWYNVISMIRKSGIYYYCNLASPSLYDGEAIKNIDYDLDVKLYPNRSYEILDEGEYRDHAAAMRER